MATMLRSSSAALRRLLLLSRASYSSFAGAGSAHSRLIPATAVAGDRISGSKLASNWNPSRTFSVPSNPNTLPKITDPEIESAFKDLLATNWDEIPDSVKEEAKKAVTKETKDLLGQQHLKDLFRSAEACEEFSGTLVSLRMTLDDLSGLTGENVGPLPVYVHEAVKSAYNRYMNYLNSFGEGEWYLRKKVETEIGTKLIHLKMRCSGIGSEWGKITLIGTSGISGSYVELRS